MGPTSQLLSFTALTLFSFSFASSLPPQIVNCEVVTTGLSPSCWDELNMNSWMRNWLASTSSNATSAGTGQCRSHELWSTCFLRLSLGVTGRDCSTINTNGENSTCVMPTLGDPPHDPRMFYAVWNIYSINTYTTTLTHALQTLSLTSPTTLTTAALTTANGTPRFPTNTTTTHLPIDLPLRILLEKETYGFFLPASPNAGLLNFLSASPPARTYYGPSTSVPDLVRLLQRRLGQVLERVMGDLGGFLMVVEGGGFSSTGGVVDWQGLVRALES